MKHYIAYLILSFIAILNFYFLFTIEESWLKAVLLFSGILVTMMSKDSLDEWANNTKGKGN